MLPNSMMNMQTLDILMQIEVHPNWRNQRVVDFAKEHNILITAYAPLSSPGTMASRHLPVPNLAKVTLLDHWWIFARAAAQMSPQILAVASDTCPVALVRMQQNVPACAQHDMIMLVKPSRIYAKI